MTDSDKPRAKEKEVLRIGNAERRSPRTNGIHYAGKKEIMSVHRKIMKDY